MCSEQATTPGDGLALVAEDLGKVYRIYDHPRDRLLQAFWGDRRRLYREFWALEHVSLDLRRGETLGIVGRNGSGKSTLLQLICGTLTPTYGRVSRHGRIGALLELGSGFNPEFSGRENVFLNATLLGLSQRQIEERLDTILAFADIGDFIDQPVKTYSSGMVIRLAFAVQAHVDPEILVVDEALAVGDELFQKKCYAHLQRLKERGTSILLVTHSCPQIVMHCDRAMILHKGRARLTGHPQAVTVMYQRLSNARDAEWDRALAASTSSPTDPAAGPAAAAPTADVQLIPAHATAGRPAEPHRPWLDPQLVSRSSVTYPSQGGRIEAITILTAAGEAANTFPFNEPFSIQFNGFADEDLRDVTFACLIAAHNGQRITGQSYPGRNAHVPLLGAGTAWSLRFHFRGGLWPGVYLISGGVYLPMENSRAVHRMVDNKALRVIAGTPITKVGAACLSASAPDWHTTEAYGSVSSQA
ncbi:MAG: ABC transporter ATP-binding protein [Cyanobacteriota bacterium]|nr:ABC transporter ATP-binding protein [Cyanobacteriota bacterium]